MCDTDKDDCLSPSEIGNLINVIERVFARECSNVNIDSTCLLENICEKRAQRKFLAVMALFVKHTAIDEDKLITFDGIGFNSLS